jgi:hypothetical protein
MKQNLFKTEPLRTDFFLLKPGSVSHRYLKFEVFYDHTTSYLYIGHKSGMFVSSNTVNFLHVRGLIFNKIFSSLFIYFPRNLILIIYIFSCVPFLFHLGLPSKVVKLRSKYTTYNENDLNTICYCYVTFKVEVETDCKLVDFLAR